MRGVRRRVEQSVSPQTEVETDPRLLALSDSEILLNFAVALEAIFPFMRTVHADRYDPYDDVVEPLFWALVYSTFAGKYGVAVPKKGCAAYEMSVPDYSVLHHVRVRPRGAALALVGNRWARYEGSLELAFMGFGDGRLWLSGGESDEDPEFKGFDLVRVQPLNPSGVPVEQAAWTWFRRDEVEYQFIEAKK